MWILPGTMTEAEGEESVEKIKGLITTGGGEVKSAALWARRTLSYPIEKNREGAYYLAKFSMDSASTQELDRAVTADQSILRHLLVKDEAKKKTAAAES
jgi:small subunit ribosomal protein S6